MDKVIEFTDCYGSKKKVKLIEAKCYREKVLIPIPENCDSLAGCPLTTEVGRFNGIIDNTFRYQKIRIINNNEAIVPDNLSILGIPDYNDYHLLLSLIASSTVTDLYIYPYSMNIVGMGITNKIYKNSYIETYIHETSNANEYSILKLSNFIKENYLND